MAPSKSYYSCSYSYPIPHGGPKSRATQEPQRRCGRDLRDLRLQMRFQEAVSRSQQEIEAPEAFVRRFGRDQAPNLRRHCQSSRFFQGSFGQSQGFASVWKPRQQALHGLTTNNNVVCLFVCFLFFFQFSEI